MDMDDDMYDQPPPVRRSEYSSSDSQCRILVSNLQPSVTADDIVVSIFCIFLRLG